MKPRHASWLLLLALIGVGQFALIGVGQFAAAQVDLLAVQADGTPAQLAPTTEVPNFTAQPSNTVEGTAQLAEPSAAQQLDIVPVTAASEQLLDPAADAQTLFPFQEVGTGASTFCGLPPPNGACQDVTSLTLFAAADPGRSSRRRGGGKPDRPGVGDPAAPQLPLPCGVGGSPKMKYSSNDGRFVSSNFAKECLGDAAVGCDNAANTAGVAGNPNPPSTTNSCCSCALYAEHCAGVTSKYVQDRTLSSGVDHVLVMPSAPCTGVENWNKGLKVSGKMCPGEAIWTAAQGVIDAAKLTDEYAWGAAINPVSRRGQHQMHIHLARVFPSMHATIAGAFWGLELTQFDLDCGAVVTSGTRLKNCKIATKTSTNPKLPVVIVKATTAAAATPFLTVYSNKLDNIDPNGPVLFTSTLVLRVPFVMDHYAVIKNPKGPAECFFDPRQSQSLANGCQ